MKRGLVQMTPRRGPPGPTPPKKLVRFEITFRVG